MRRITVFGSQKLIPLEIVVIAFLLLLSAVCDGSASDPPVLAPRYRLYNPNNGQHHYTTSENEYNVLYTYGWVQEGIACYMYDDIASVDSVNSVPYYRLYNPNTGDHHWTTDLNEYTVLPTYGWVQEGVDGYVFGTAVTGSGPLYRLYNPNDGPHHWTMDLNERNVLVGYGWVDEGIACYVFSSETGTPLSPNIAFVTSTTYDGNLGGLAGADAKCQERAVAAGLPQNTYRAWLSTSSVNAIDRLGAARGWVRVDGKPFADTKADITSGKILYPLRVDELGNYDDSLGAVWTGTAPNGTFQSDETCSDWQASSSELTGSGGWSDGAGDLFTSIVHVSCPGTFPLYCFGTDNNVQVTVTPVAGRIAFLAKTGWTSGVGLVSADQKCMDEAQQAGLGGTFKALLASDGASAESRFDLDGLPWVRPDGIAIAPTAADLFSASFLDSPINQSADGLQYYGNWGVFTGAATPRTAGTPETTCKNWLSDSGTDTVVGGRAGSTAQQRFFGFDTDLGCNAGWEHLYCLEE